jgi:hypothetical protein
MATYSFSINDRTKAAKSLLVYMRSLGLNPEKVAAPRKNGLDAAIEDVAAGHVFHAENGTDLVRKCLA